jgi:hypothetical protein
MARAGGGRGFASPRRLDRREGKRDRFVFGTLSAYDSCLKYQTCPAYYATIYAGGPAVQFDLFPPGGGTTGSSSLEIGSLPRGVIKARRAFSSIFRLVAPDLHHGRRSRPSGSEALWDCGGLDDAASALGRWWAWAAGCARAPAAPFGGI